jgi:hypothetical protein
MDVAQVVAIDGHAAGLGIVEAQRQADQRRLPAPLSPTTATVAPAGTSRSTSLSTGSPSR